MSIYNNGCMNCSVCGKFCNVENAGDVEWESSDLEHGMMCVSGITCKACIAKQNNELKNQHTTQKG